MDTRRVLWSAAITLVFAACGTASRQDTLTVEQEIARAKSGIVASRACEMRGTTLNVPSQKYPTIAAALAAARSGDLVRVAPGTYPECPVLVDGVILQGLPGATLDGAGCDPTILGVVSGDATIVHGATVQGFTILPSAIAGVYLNGTRGVHLLDIQIAGTSRPVPRTIWMEASTGAYVGGCRLDGPGGVSLFLGSSAVLWDLSSSLVRSSQSSFVLERSRILGLPGRDSVTLTQGSQAVLVGNDITGTANGVNVTSGSNGVDPLWAPSKAWLMDNLIHDCGGQANEGSGINGLNVGGTGSEVHGVRNRYPGNGRGLTVSGGGSYLGFQDSFTDNLSVGVFAYGVSVRNSTAFSEEAVIKLDEATVRGNLQGGMAACGSTLELRNSTVTGNQGNGAQLNSHCFWGGQDQGSAPSRLSAHGTGFTKNGGWGVIAYEDSQLLLGSLADPGMNGFFSNIAGSIANFSTNHVDARWNWFGTSDKAAIAPTIGGDVAYEPFLTRSPHPQAATPTFSPGAGSYPIDQSVTIRCSTPGAEIHYTTNGSLPGVDSTLYTGPILVAGAGTSVTIQAVATRKGMMESVVAGATYTIGASNRIRTASGTPMAIDGTVWARCFPDEPSPGASRLATYRFGTGTFTLSDTIHPSSIDCAGPADPGLGMSVTASLMTEGDRQATWSGAAPAGLPTSVIATAAYIHDFDLPGLPPYFKYLFFVDDLSASPVLYTGEGKEGPWGADGYPLELGTMGRTLQP